MEKGKVPPEPHDPGGAARRAQWQRHASVVAEYFVLVTLAGVFLWRGFIPAWKSLNTDFPDCYLAARLYRQGYSLDQIYDWTWIQRQKDHAGIERPIVTFTLLTPFSLLPVLPFSSLPPLPAKRCWLVVNLILLAVAGYFLFRMTSLGPRRVAILMFLALVPLRTNFLFGQEYVLLLFLLVLAAWAYLEGRPATSGVILAVAGGLKIYPALYVIFLARKKQWRAAAGLLVGSLAIWMASVFLFGFETIRTYIIEVLPWPLRGEGQDPYNATWNSFTALLHRLFVREPELNPHPIIHLPAAYAILQPVCQGLIFVPFLWLISSRRSNPERDKLEWAGFAAMLLMLSTNPASYDFNALILTAVLAANYLFRRDRRWEAAALIILYAFVCFPTYRWAPSSPEGWQTLLAFPRLWAMTGLWVCLIIVFLRSNSGTVMAKLRSREAAAFGMIFLVLVALGVTTNLIQQRGEFMSYPSRVLPPPGFLLATDPAVAGGVVLFTAMTADGYGTKSFGKGSLNSIGFGKDSFHPATAPGLPFVWVELASSRSRIFRFPLNATGSVPGNAVLEAEDAEKPAMSPDGKWLAFIRETHGRGALWAKKIDLGNGGTRSAAPLP